MYRLWQENFQIEIRLIRLCGSHFSIVSAETSSLVTSQWLENLSAAFLFTDLPFKSDIKLKCTNCWFKLLKCVTFFHFIEFKLRIFVLWAL